MDAVFEALASQVRRRILAYLSAGSLTAGEIADRFDISKPSVSKHLSILENAGLIKGERRASSSTTRWCARAWSTPSTASCRRYAR